MYFSYLYFNYFTTLGVTLLWFRSYLSGRSYRVWFAGAASRIVYVVCSVPHGPVLGPRLFIMYSADLADRAVEHDVNFHGYADDIQLYVHCRPQDIGETTAKLERCITDIYGLLDVCEQAQVKYGQDGTDVGRNKIQHVNVE